VSPHLESQDGRYSSGDSLWNDCWMRNIADVILNNFHRHCKHNIAHNVSKTYRLILKWRMMGPGGMEVETWVSPPVIWSNIENRNLMTDLTVSLRSYWTFKSCWTWRRVHGWAFIRVSKDCVDFVFRVKQSEQISRAGRQGIRNISERNVVHFI